MTSLSSFDPNRRNRAMTGDLTGTIVDLARRISVLERAGSGTPIAGIIVWPRATGTIPANFLRCDGSTPLIADWPLLAAALGTTYGGNGTTTFGLPNLLGRAVVGVDTGQTEFDTLGETGGAKTVALTEANLASHDHPMAHTHGTDLVQGDAGGVVWAVNTGTASYRIVAGTSGASSAANTSAAGSGTAHNNLQPYMALHYIIRAA